MAVPETIYNYYSVNVKIHDENRFVRFREARLNSFDINNAIVVEQDEKIFWYKGTNSSRRTNLRDLALIKRPVRFPTDPATLLSIIPHVSSRCRPTSKIAN